MANFNCVILVGNVTRDPQMSYLPSQTPVVEFGMAVNRKWTDQSGNKKEEVCFVDCRAFGKSAETINQYVTKGSPLLIEGRLTFDQWEGKDGSKHSKHRVIVERFQFLGGEGVKGRTDAPAIGQRAEPQQAAPVDFPDDDIPF